MNEAMFSQTLVVTQSLFRIHSVKLKKDIKITAK